MTKRFHQKRAREFMLQYAPIELRYDAVTGSHGVLIKDEPLRKLSVHQTLEMGYCHSGQGYLVAEDKIFAFEEGDVAISSPAEGHALRSKKGTESTWSFVHIDPLRLVDMLAEFPALLQLSALHGPEFPNVLAGSDFPEIVSALRLLLQEMQQRRPGYRVIARSLAVSLLGYVHRLPGVSHDQKGRSTDAIIRIAPALEMMRSNYAQPLRVVDLAKRCNVCESHFRKLFREAVGLSPHQYLINVRLHIGGYLLRTTDKNVLEIALILGYEDVTNFNRNFVRFFHCSPIQYRKQVRAIKEV